MILISNYISYLVSCLTIFIGTVTATISLLNGNYWIAFSASSLLLANMVYNTYLQLFLIQAVEDKINASQRSSADYF